MRVYLDRDSALGVVGEVHFSLSDQQRNQFGDMLGICEGCEEHHLPPYRCGVLDRAKGARVVLQTACEFPNVVCAAESELFNCPAVWCRASPQPDCRKPMQ